VKKEPPRGKVAFVSPGNQGKLTLFTGGPKRMNYSGLQLKLREQLHEFVGKLSSHFSKPTQRFLEQMLHGIQSSGDVKLSLIARSLGEDISLLKTETRLSRNLMGEDLERRLLFEVARMGSRRVHKDTLFLIDLTDVRKLYAKKMEYLATVRDGSTGEFAKGYWMCQVVACESESKRMIPLYQSLYSAEAEGFVSENDEILRAVNLISVHTKDRGIWVMDRGGSRINLIEEFLTHHRRFIVRLRADFGLVVQGTRRKALDIALGCPMLYSEVIVRETDGGEKSYTIHYGYRQVKVAGHQERLYLVVVKGFGEEPLILLTNRELKRTRSSLWFVVGGYLTRWRIEESIRFIKQSYHLEDIRVQSYRRLKNLAALVLCAAYFASVYLGESLKLQVLTRRVLKAAKRFFGVPEFHYYALADGIAAILSRSSKGPLCGSPPKIPIDNQQWLFNTF
jgi:hypothetical protein